MGYVIHKAHAEQWRLQNCSTGSLLQGVYNSVQYLTDQHGESELPWLAWSLRLSGCHHGHKDAQTSVSKCIKRRDVSARASGVRTLFIGCSSNKNAIMDHSVLHKLASVEPFFSMLQIWASPTPPNELFSLIIHPHLRTRYNHTCGDDDPPKEASSDSSCLLRAHHASNPHPRRHTPHANHLNLPSSHPQITTRPYTSPLQIDPGRIQFVRYYVLIGAGWLETERPSFWPPHASLMITRPFPTSPRQLHE